MFGDSMFGLGETISVRRNYEWHGKTGFSFMVLVYDVPVFYKSFEDLDPNSTEDLGRGGLETKKAFAERLATVLNPNRF